jgi:dTMP kinase
VLIAVEGIDGSGKGTQSRKILDALKAHDLSASLVQFPRYSETFFGREIGQYLNGEFGALMDVHPKLGALLYAGDRFESTDFIAGELANCDVVVCDRYTPSNQAHHAAKLPREQWLGFFEWVDKLEYGVFRVRRPDIVFFLDTDSSAASNLISKKPPRDYTDRAADIHEIDTIYQSNVHSAYQLLAERNAWARISCSIDGIMKSEDEIFALIWAKLKENLKIDLA